MIKIFLWIFLNHKKLRKIFVELLFQKIYVFLEQTSEGQILHFWKKKNNQKIVLEKKLILEKWWISQNISNIRPC